MKTTKYKLSDMAKDLKVTNNDLIECLGKLGGDLLCSGVLYTEQSGGQL